MSKIIGKSRQPFNTSFDVDFLNFLDWISERTGKPRNELIVEAVEGQRAVELKQFRTPIKRSLFHSNP